MLDRLQRRREEEHRRQMPQQDPYEQYMSANQGYPYPQQHYQYTPLSSVPGSVMHRGEGMQPQLPRSVHVPTAQPPLMNVSPSRERQQERQSLQESPRRRIPPSLTPATQTSSSRVSSEVLSYMTPPELRRPPLPNNSSQPQNQDYFSPQHPAGGIPQPSTHGDIAHSPPANYTPRLPSTTNSAQAAHVHDLTNQPPGYSATEMKNNVQGNVASTPPLREKHQS